MIGPGARAVFPPVVIDWIPAMRTKAAPAAYPGVVGDVLKILEHGADVYLLTTYGSDKGGRKIVEQWCEANDLPPLTVTTKCPTARHVRLATRSEISVVAENLGFAIRPL